MPRVRILASIASYILFMGHGASISDPWVHVAFGPLNNPNEQVALLDAWGPRHEINLNPKSSCRVHTCRCLSADPQSSDSLID